MNNDLVWHYGLGGGHLFRKLIWGNMLIDKKNQCCHGSVLSVLQALTTFSTTSVTSSPHIWFFTLLAICFWKISLALSKQPAKIDINTHEIDPANPTPEQLQKYFLFFIAFHLQELLVKVETFLILEYQTDLRKDSFYVIKKQTWFS